MSACINYLIEANLSMEDKTLQRALQILSNENDKEKFQPNINRVKNADLLKVYKKNNIRKIKHLELIDKLRIDRNQAIIIGSSVLVLCNIVNSNDDLDLVVTKPAFNKAAKSVDVIKTYKREYNKVFYQTPHQELELAVNFQILGTTTEKLLSRAVNIEGYNFMSLRDTYRMYNILNRAKDIDKLAKLKKIFSVGHL